MNDHLFAIPARLEDAMPTAAAAQPDGAALVETAVRSLHLMAAGSRAEFDPLYQPSAIDRESRIQPPP